MTDRPDTAGRARAVSTERKEFKKTLTVSVLVKELRSATCSPHLLQAQIHEGLRWTSGIGPVLCKEILISLPAIFPLDQIGDLHPEQRRLLAGAVEKVTAAK